MLTVHGRTRLHNKQYNGPANYNIIRKIKETLRIPVVLNGGISDFSDVKKALDFTGCDGVMSSESILEYPALFDPSKVYDMDDLIEEYLDFAERYPGESNLKVIADHLFKFMHCGFVAQGHGDLRTKLHKLNSKRGEG